MLRRLDGTHQPPVGPAEIEPRQRSALRRYNTWRKFHDGPRKRGSLLKNLTKYPDAVLVAGCQRSGTTMLTRIIAQAMGFRRLALTHDDELDAALALCDEIDLPGKSRYCFQTTYLNEAYREYRTMGSGNRLIWVVRNPYSVVHSMVNNWRRFALTELYEACGLDHTNSARLQRVGFPWPFGPSYLEKACLSYSAKTMQILEIRELIPPSRILVTDYDQMVKSPDVWLRAIFRFIGEPFDDAYSSMVRADSINKANALSPAARRFIHELCEPAYRRCLNAVSGPVFG
jgi:Sulfotransferase domain